MDVPDTEYEEEAREAWQVMGKQDLGNVKRCQLLDENPVGIKEVLVHAPADCCRFKQLETIPVPEDPCLV